MPRRKLSSAPRFDDIHYYIWDATEMAYFDIEEKEVDFFAATDKAATYYQSHIRGALISTDPRTRRILNRYIETSNKLHTPWQLKLFDNLQEARNWACNKFIDNEINRTKHL